MHKSLLPGFLLLAGVVVPARAQLRLGYGVGAGVTTPTGDFHAAARGEGFSRGLEGLLFAAAGVGGLPFSFRLDATYSLNGANEQLKSQLNSAILGGGASESVNRIGASLDLVWDVPVGSRLRPYALGGAGMYRTGITVKVPGSSGTTTETKFGWNAGAGLRLGLKRASLFLEGRLVSVSPLNALPRMTFVPLVFGVRLGSV